MSAVHTIATSRTEASTAVATIRTIHPSSEYHRGNGVKGMRLKEITKLTPLSMTLINVISFFC